MKKIFLGLMACAALCACTSDDLVSSVTSQKVFEGDVAYMTVSIKDVGTATRATSPTNSFEYGTADEYAVSTADFYFYDDEGVFVSEAEVWDGGTPSVHDDETPDGNVEFKSNTVIVLKGLTGKSYPNCVVTVLNKPTSFKPGETLDEMAALLADASGVGIMKGTNTNFTMSTSSYVPTTPFTTTTGKTSYYFVTPLSESDFYEEPVTDWSSDATDGKPVPVDIYVERLAAKVQVGIGSDLATNATTITESDGTTTHTVYKLEVTIAGDPNVEDDVAEQEYGDGIGAEDVYVEIIGWGLNATAKHSLMMKDIESADKWTNTSTYTLGFEWNDADNFRSYWGKSFNYGLTPEDGSYPTESGGASNAANSTTTGKDINEYLDYISYNELTLPTISTETTVNYTYCAENTNTAAGTTLTGGIITNKNSSAITSVLVAAKVWGVDADGYATALDLVRYNGELFTEEAYLNYVMAELTATGALNVYVKNTDDTYTHIDGSYVTLEEGTDGSVNVVVNSDAFSDTYYYYKDDNPGEYEAYTNAAAAISAVTTALTSFNTNAGANAFTGGMMYYNIPIEHLNNTTATDGETGLPIIYEANYGVVRNHWYRLTITSIEDLGTGVYDPDEVIIPNPDDVPTYYLGADIHILSWKMVGQGVDL